MAANSLQCIVVTPEQTVVDSAADFVAMPLFDGELGVGLHHAPMIGRLGYGELRIRSGGDVQRYYVDGGFVQVADNLVSVLTNRAVPAASLDAGEAQEAVSRQLARKVAGDDEIMLRDRALAQSRAQLRVAEKSR